MIIFKYIVKLKRDWKRNIENKNHQGHVHNVEHSHINCSNNNTHGDATIYNEMEACHRQENKGAHSHEHKHVHRHKHNYEEGHIHSH